MGTLLDEQNLDVQVKISPLELQRQKYILQMKMNKNRENETLSKLQDFRYKLRAEAKTDTNWMSNKLKFHIDSQRAYDVNKAQSYAEKQGTGAKFEDYLVGGDQNKKFSAAYS